MTDQTTPDVTDDGFHTMQELYDYRCAYHALFAKHAGTQFDAHKSWRHNDGEECFGGGWFIVTMQLPTGQVSNHYPAEKWDMFNIPEWDVAAQWDGHTPAEALYRMNRYALQETPMTDQNIPDVANNERRLARDWAEHIESNTAIWAGTARVRAAARVILNDVPAPPRPTLADMTDEERAACQRMQADVANRSVRYVIVNPYVAEGDAALTSADGGIEWFSPDRVTPRPDLPRIEWPAAAPVPPNTLAVGSEWDDVDTMARACEESGRDQIVVTDKDGDVSVWGADAGWWETGSPDYGFEPYTIIHAGKKADQ